MSNIGPVSGAGAYLGSRSAAAAGPGRGESSRRGASSEAHGVGGAPVHGRTEPIRAELVSRVRTQLASGSYDVDGKLDSAMDRLLTEVDLHG